MVADSRRLEECFGIASLNEYDLGRTFQQQDIHHYIGPGCVLKLRNQPRQNTALSHRVQTFD